MPLVNPDEWIIAHQRLDNAVDGTKLPYSTETNGAPRAKWPDLFPDYKTTHSFIKLHGEIYALAHPVIGQGTFGKVKYMENRQGQRSVAKIEEEKTFARETEILADLQLSRGKSRTPYRNKFYTHMNDLGESLDSLLRRPEELNVERRFRLGIDLCLRVHRLHHGLDSLTGTAYAHLDLKTNNCTVDSQNRIHLVDFGAAEAEVDRVLEKSWGTYLLRPPVNRQMTKKQYDVLALKRSLFMPRELYSADGYISVCLLAGILTSSELQDYHLDAFINTSHQHRATLESFCEDDSTPLLLAAILIVSHYQLPVDRSTLKNNRLLCLVLASMHENNKTADEMRQAVSDVDACLRSLFPDFSPETPMTLVKARFINEQLGLKIPPEDLSAHADKANLINQLYAHDMLGHWKDIEQFSPEWQTAVLVASPELLNAVKLILNQTSADTFRTNCLQELFARPDLAHIVSLDTLKARRLQKRYTFEMFSQAPEKTAIILFTGFLYVHGLYQYREQIKVLPGLRAFIQSPYVTTFFLNRLKEDLARGGAYMDKYKDKMPVIELLHRRGIDQLDTQALNGELTQAITHCDRCILSHAQFQRDVMPILTSSALYFPNGVNPAAAINAIAAAGGNHLREWIRCMATPDPLIAASYVRVACSLAAQGAAGARYDEMFQALWSAQSVAAFNALISQSGLGAQHKPQVPVPAVGQSGVLQSPDDAEVRDPRLEAQAKIASLGMERQYAEFIGNTRSICEFNSLLTFANTPEQVLFCRRLCQRLDRLRAKMDSFDPAITARWVLHDVINKISDSIELRFSHPSDRATYLDRCRHLQADIVERVNSARFVLGRHRGVMGWVDSFLAVLAGIVCLRPDRRPSPHTFFQTKTDSMLTDFVHILERGPRL